MQVIRVERTGGPEVLTVGSSDLPAPVAGQAQVRVRFAGVNFLDVYHRRGDYSMPLPLIPGVEGVGVIDDPGPEETGLKLGQRVGWIMNLGSYAEKVNIPASRLIPLPDPVANDVAAAGLLQGLTAHFLSRDTYTIQPGDVVLVHSAAGGVGSLLVQMAKMRGARILATVSTEDKAADALAAGSEAVIDSRSEDLVSRVHDLTRGRGVQAVYDAVGQTTWRQSLDCLARRGFLILYGQASGPIPPLDLDLLKAKGSLYVTRPTIADYTANREELLQRAREVLEWIAAGTLRIRIHQTLPLDAAADAHRLLEGRQTRGKLLLRPGRKGPGEHAG